MLRRVAPLSRLAANDPKEDQLVPAARRTFLVKCSAVGVCVACTPAGTGFSASVGRSLSLPAGTTAGGASAPCGTLASAAQI